jgi:putative heme-binding domain-containing protein
MQKRFLYFFYTCQTLVEHALHGLNWAPDGKLYMSKGNSRGYDRPGKRAPEPFRDLYGLPESKAEPHLPAPKVFKKGEYKRSYHHPADHWGRDGGVLCCDDLGKNLEIVARGFRNPWDIAFDDGFNWLGTDNDQDEGDRIFMPFVGAHFGWGHPWSYHWTGAGHPPTVPLSGPLFHGSGTGIVYYTAPQFPLAYRNVFFINDWARGITYLYRPSWEGALLKEAEGKLHNFVTRQGLFRPTDLAVGPAGSLFIGGWGNAYGVQWQLLDGKKEQVNEGRIFLVCYGKEPPGEATWKRAKRTKPRAAWTVAELLDDLHHHALPVWRINAQNELVHRGAKVIPELRKALTSGKLSRGQETWTAWALGRIAPEDPSIERFFARCITAKEGVSLNLKIQSLRILAHRIRQFGKVRELPSAVVAVLSDPEPRLRFEAVQAIGQARQRHLVDALLEVADRENDRLTFYSCWHALAELLDLQQRKALLQDKRAGVRFAGLLGLLESRALTLDEAWEVANRDADPRVQEWALHYALNALPTGPVTSKREDWSRYRYRFFDQVLGKIEESKNPRIRSALLELLSRVEYRGNQWDRLKDLYQNLKRSKTPAHDLAPLLCALGKESKAIPLLWEALNEDEPLRQAALDGFVQSTEPDRASSFLLEHLPGSAGQQQLRAVAALAQLVGPGRVWRGEDETLQVLTRMYKETDDPRVRRDILLILLGIDVHHLKASKTGYPAVVALIHRASADPDPRVHSLVSPIAQRLGESISVTAKRTPATIASVLPLLDKADPKRGEKIFFDSRRGNCAACHRVGGRGTAFAPPLSDIGSRAKVEAIVASILKPSAKITEGFHVTVITTTTGKVLSGVVRQQTATTVELFQTDGRTIEVPLNRIEEQVRSQQSIMPGNFGEVLAKEEIADLAVWLMRQRGE